MKNKSIKLSLLIFILSVLISSRQDAGACNPDENLKRNFTGLEACSGYAATLSGKQKQEAAIKKGLNQNQQKQSEALTDNELPLSPISHFIILQ